jgi:hypothetical protein
MKNLLLLILVFACCISCNKGVRKKLGLTTYGPNEYSVKKYPKLKVPSEFTLPEVQYKGEHKLSNKVVQKDASDVILPVVEGMINQNIQ